MKLAIAISGKGGVGKSTFAVLLAKELAKKEKVLLLDADPVPTTSKLLGIKQEIKPLARMTELIDERTSVDATRRFFKLNPDVSDVVDKVAVPYSENLKLLVLGTIEITKTGCFCPENAFLKAFLRHLTKLDKILILDMEAGIEHLTRGTIQNVDLMAIVTEPSARAVEVASAIKTQAENIGITKQKIFAILNKVRSEEEIRMVKRLLDKLDLPLIAAIPYDEKIATIEKSGAPLKSCICSTKRELIKLTNRIFKPEDIHE